MECHMNELNIVLMLYNNSVQYYCIYVYIYFVAIF